MDWEIVRIQLVRGGSYFRVDSPRPIFEPFGLRPQPGRLDHSGNPCRPEPCCLSLRPFPWSRRTADLHLAVYIYGSELSHERRQQTFRIAWILPFRLIVTPHQPGLPRVACRPLRPRLSAGAHRPPDRARVAGPDLQVHHRRSGSSQLRRVSVPRRGAA